MDSCPRRHPSDQKGGAAMSDTPSPIEVRYAKELRQLNDKTLSSYAFVKWENKRLETDKAELLAENAALREAALFLLNEIDGEAFHQVGQANGEMLYEGVGKLRAVIDTVKKEAGDDAIMLQHLTEGGTPT
jgi:hypothetical protein